MLALASGSAGSIARVAGIILCVVGAGLLAGGLGLRYFLARRRRRGVRTEGTIVDFRTRSSHASSTFLPPSPDGIATPASTGGGPVYYPIVEFRTADGETVRATSPVGSNPRPGRVGDVAVVHYDPRDPERVVVDTSRSRTMTGCGEIVLAGLGAILLAIGIALLAAAH